MVPATPGEPMLVRLTMRGIRVGVAAMVLRGPWLALAVADVPAGVLGGATFWPGDPAIVARLERPSNRVP